MVWWLLTLSIFAASPLARAERVDRVVAVVDTQLVLDSEVRLEAELARLDQGASPFWDPGRSTPQDRLIDAAAVRLAAGQVVLYEPPPDEVRARREAIRARFGDRRSWLTFLTRHGLTEETLLVVLKRRMVVERYLARNIQVPPEDAAAWRRAADALVAELRARARVRTIPEERR